MSAATPNICTGIIAFVRGVMSFSADAAFERECIVELAEYGYGVAGDLSPQS